MFNFLTQKEQLFNERKNREALAAKQEKTDVASAIAFVTLAEAGAIDEVTSTENIDVFSPWAEGIAYPVGAIRSFNGILYRCVQAHTSQIDWMPDETPSLWTEIGDPAEEWPAWSQPVGAHDAYNAGDKVSYNEKHWISTMDGNVFAPGVYGWDEV